jgi:sugar lactone lactonase YvrE
MLKLSTTSLAVLAATLSFSGAALAQEKVQVGSGQKEFPESVSSLSDGTLFFGSITGGNVLKASPGATTTEEFVPAAADGPKAVIGVLADEASSSVWVCYADLAWFGGQEGLPSMLRSYDAATGAEKGSYTFTGPSFCNDIAIGADGAAYAADTVAGSVVRTTADGGVETWKQDAMLAGADGLSFGPDGTLYVNSVTANKLFRIDVNADGTAGAITEIATSEPLAGPDGMRFGDDGVLYVAQNGSGVASALTIDGDSATVANLEGTYVGPTAVTKVGDTLWVLEAKIGMMQSGEDPGMFFAHPVALK